MLAIFYLKHNKRRSWLTILGVAITVIVLYAILNVSLDQLIINRDAVRAEADFDLMLFTQKEEEINEITKLDEVKEAYTGEVYDNESDTLYKNGLYVNLKNPYRMKKVLEKINSQFNVRGEMNDRLAAYYLQLGDENLVFGMIMAVLLLSYIFAIFGVGIIRNSIQLYSLEQIKDYGILRCIGATKKQLRTYIYMMGAVLEIMGIILGVLLGYPVCLLIGIIFRRVIHFHFLPILLILFVFLGDMYFVMQENCKFVNELTPISAVRGEFRIKKERIKVRNTKGIRKMLGIEGEYAYKSLMRNKGRFLKSICAIGIGIGAFVAMISILETADKRLSEEEEKYGEYQVYYYLPIEAEMDTNRVESCLPNNDLLTAILEEECIEKAKRMYVSTLYATSSSMVVGKLSKEYIENTYMGNNDFRVYNSDMDKSWKDCIFSGVSLWGLDDEDYAK